MIIIFLNFNPEIERNSFFVIFEVIAIEKLEKEDKPVQIIFTNLENRTNTFLSISLGIFSLQVTLLTNTILNIFQEYTIPEYIKIIILILFLTNILLNLNAILNFRRSSKISEKTYKSKFTQKEKIYENFNEINYLKKRIL